MQHPTEARILSATSEVLARLDDESLIDGLEAEVVAGYIKLDSGKIVQVSVVATADRSNWIPDKHAPKR